jgi:hypothetical protein
LLKCAQKVARTAVAWAGISAFKSSLCKNPFTDPQNERNQTLHPSEQIPRKDNETPAQSLDVSHAKSSQLAASKDGIWHLTGPTQTPPRINAAITPALRLNKHLGVAFVSYDDLRPLFLA